MLFRSLGSVVGTIDQTLVSVLTRIDYYGRYYATYQKVEPVLCVCYRTLLIILDDKDTTRRHDKEDRA